MIDSASTDAGFEFVEHSARLAELCQQWCRQPCLAVDTEFVRTDTFYPNLGLIQVSDGANCWLVDPLAITDLNPFAQLLEDSGVVKVFHACSEDLEVLQQALGVLPTPMIDTQVAAAFTGLGFSRGYAALVEQVLGIQLCKHETRSDWLQRPLSEAQCRYAAEDVYYLLPLYQHITSLLGKTGRLAWVEQEVGQMLAKAAAGIAPDHYYLKIKGVWQLRRDELAVLQSLAAWRESTARQRNKPRNRIVNDRLLWEIARCKPCSHRDLSRVPEIHPRVQRQYGDTLLEMVAAALAADNNQWPQRLPRPLGREASVWLKQLRAIQSDVASQLGVAGEVLARKKDLEDIISSALAGEPRLPAHWRGNWRETVIGDRLLEAVPTG